MAKTHTIRAGIESRYYRIARELHSCIRNPSPVLVWGVNRALARYLVECGYDATYCGAERRRRRLYGTVIVLRSHVGIRRIITAIWRLLEYGGVLMVPTEGDCDPLDSFLLEYGFEHVATGDGFLFYARAK